MRTLAVILLASATAIPLSAAQATETPVRVLHSFTGAPDGALPYVGVIRDNAGNLYGTTTSGGANNDGAIFKLAPDGTETVLHSFTGSDGNYPQGDLIFDQTTGAVYGNALYGGASGYGVVFELAPDGTYTVLHAFTNGSDGGFPVGHLIRDRAGNFYGVAQLGGATGYGVIYELASDGTFTVLHNFAGSDGSYPVSGLTRDARNFYGTALSGGANNNGVAYKLTADGTFTVLHAFAGGSDGINPYGGVTKDKLGDLYGDTYGGGGGANCSGGCGVVYKIAPDGTYSILHAFTGGADDGANPEADLLRTRSGKLYSTTYAGGTLNQGTVFEITPHGAEKILHSFIGGASDGAYPSSRLIKDKDGNFYGTTNDGGSSSVGTVYTMKK
jgi:uncharacterized repeat protein (TIGR03803 family)